MLTLAEAGFRAIAPDSRGQGLSGQPQEPDKATWEDLTSDLLAILDTVHILKVIHQTGLHMYLDHEFLKL